MSSLSAIPAPSAAAPPPTQPRHTRVEWVVFAVICLIGVGLRSYRLDHLSIEHFDEGVYAANLYADLDDYKYPQRHLYAPPLFPLLCELAISIGGTPDAAIWVNLLFGSLMIPLVWFVARDSFGTVAAIVAATLCATSDYHIFFSRSALTDVSLGFWLLLAVWLAGKGMRSGSGLTLGGAAIAAALAWWTKYNGWLAIAIPLGGWGLLAILSVMKTPGPLKTRLAGIDRDGLVRWGLFALVAALLWSPVVYGLQSVGGYSVVAKNHAGYLVGLSGWWDGLRMHFAYHGWLTSAVGVGGLLVAGILLVFHQRQRGIDWVGELYLLLVPAAVIGVGGTVGLVSLIAVVWQVRNWLISPSVSGTALAAGSPHRTQSQEPAASTVPLTDSNPHRIMEAILVTWWIGLTLTTPLYTPYARLSLPWLVSSWLLFGMLISRLSSPPTVEGLKWRSFLPTPARLLWWTVILVPLIPMVTSHPETHFNTQPLGNLPAWSDRTGLRKATGQIMHELDMGRRDMRPSEVTGYDAAVYVVGEPSLFCHLSEASQTSEMNLVVKPGANMSVAAPGPPLPTFIITGSHASPAEVAEVIAAGRMDLIWEQRVLVSDMVALDSASLQQLQVKVLKSQRGPDHTIPIRIYRVRL